MKYEIIETKIIPDNIDRYKIIDRRLKHPKFIKDRKYLEKELVNFQKGNNSKPEYPERYDLTVFTYNQFEPPYLIVDGSHRIEALKEAFKRGEIKEFKAILLPSNVLGADTAQKRDIFSRKLDQLLRDKGLPTWIKKYDFEIVLHETIESLVNISEESNEVEFRSWSNKNRIDTGREDAPTMPIDEYQKSREL